MFDSLSDRLNDTFDRLRGKGKLTEADITSAMRDIRMALLEADVNFKVVKEFVAKTKERCMTAEVMESLSPRKTSSRSCSTSLPRCSAPPRASSSLATVFPMSSCLWVCRAPVRPRLP